MTLLRPKLITFAASHFCEKARWALDWHGIAYEEIGWPPGLHQILARSCGAKHTTLPILLDGQHVIQGSGAIIDWAESKGEDQNRSLNPKAADRAEAKEIERRADEIIGIHVRRLAFAELLPNHSHLVKPALFYGASGWRRLIGSTMWPMAWRVIMRTYDIKPGAASESRSRLEAELDWLDDKLADGRAYLAGDRFSRPDLTVASLLANFARPKELLDRHECRARMLSPPMWPAGASGPSCVGSQHNMRCTEGVAVEHLQSAADPDASQTWLTVGKGRKADLSTELRQRPLLALSGHPVSCTARPESAMSRH